MCRDDRERRGSEPLRHPASDFWERDRLVGGIGRPGDKLGSGSQARIEAKLTKLERSKVCQKLFLHGPLTTVNVYARAMPGADRNAAQLMSSMLRPRFWGNEGRRPGALQNVYSAV